METMPTRALLSVYHKDGIVDFARRLHARGITLVSTGGTARALEQAGLPVDRVETLTGWPEMLDGRVKTLHPAVHAGVLADRRRPEHLEALARRGLAPIDLVVVDLYPFDDAVRANVPVEEAIELIDVGGPTLVRAAAKNHDAVTVVVDPADRDAVIAAIEAGGVDAATRRQLAAKAFAWLARYDAAIAAYLGSRGESEEAPPPLYVVAAERVRMLRYGENPHQKAALYAPAGAAPRGLVRAEPLQGRPLSYNNLLDADAACALVADLPEGAAVVIKHTNPCGVAIGRTTAADAIEAARACDPTSAFGGIVATNLPVDAAAAEVLVETFLEVVVAPEFDADARAVLARRKRLRVLELPSLGTPEPWRLHAVAGGWLLQQPDVGVEDVRAAHVVTRRSPTPEEFDALDLAWRVCKHVRSNAIVVATPDRAIGIGAGQMSRVEAAELAVRRARVPLEGTAAASDAFFPFPDGLTTLARAGVTAVVQPGGSRRDAEVIAAADAHGVAMVFTGRRHFRHG